MNKKNKKKLVTKYGLVIPHVSDVIDLMENVLEAYLNDSGQDVEVSTTPAVETYSRAFLDRYSQPPIINNKVRGQIKYLVKVLGDLDLTCALIEFYFKQNDFFYTKNLHSIGILVKNWEMLSNRKITGVTVTDSGARKLEKTSASANAVMDYLNEVGGN